MGRSSSPAGNLVAQSLAAHGSNPLAATLRGRRVSRIAVHPARQREGTGQQLIAGALQYTQDLDYLSVSFGYTGELWRFWQRCGFVLVRMGNHREASSGCYTAMALLPMSDAGKQLAEREHYRLRRDAQALAQWNGEMLPVDPLNDAVLSDDDWLELAGFAFAHRPLLTSLGCLMRLLQTSELALPALRGRLQKTPVTRSYVPHLNFQAVSCYWFASGKRPRRRYSHLMMFALSVCAIA